MDGEYTRRDVRSGFARVSWEHGAEDGGVRHGRRLAGPIGSVDQEVDCAIIVFGVVKLLGDLANDAGPFTQVFDYGVDPLVVV